jgi:iron-sulfur cluster repair protein YtfE (RIC family)
MSVPALRSLVEKLQEEHYLILMGFNNARNEGLHSERGKSELESVRRLLLAHVEKEDGSFYPHLDERARGDQQLRLLLEAIPAGMREIQDELGDFFKLLENSPAGAGVCGAFDRLYAVVKRRIEREEHILFMEIQDE